MRGLRRAGLRERGGASDARANGLASLQRPIEAARIGARLGGAIRFTRGQCVGFNRGSADVVALDDQESLSGSDESDASSDASGGSSDGAVSKLLRKTELGDGANGGTEEDGPQAGPRSPVVWFTADAVVPSTQFGVYRAIVPSVSSDPKARVEPPNGWRAALADLLVVPLVPKPS